MEIKRRNYTAADRVVTDWLAACDRAVRGRLERDRRTQETGEEETMRQVTRIHRTLVVLAVGLLALAAPLLASASVGGPGGG
jgi:ABC-type Fe2+-enterobactin transport system substrate-binding protein